MSEYRFRGRERVTIEVDGTFDGAALVLPSGLVHETPARVSLFAFAVEDLRIEGVPLARWSYPEVLWRIAVHKASEPVWWVIACDLGARGPRWAAQRYMHYPTRANSVEVELHRVLSRGAGTLALAIEPTTEPATVETRPLWTGTAATWLVPWGDDDAPALAARVRVETDTLSTVTIGTRIRWDGARLRRGREHRCGVARR